MLQTARDALSAAPSVADESPGVVDADRPRGLPVLSSRFRRSARLMAAVAAGIGALVLIGYLTRRPALAEIRAEFPPMYPNTAIAFVLTGLAVSMAVGAPAARTAATVLAVAVVTAAAITLVLIAAGAGPTAFDRLWPADGSFGPPSTPVGGRSPLETTLGFLMVGVAVLLTSRRRSPRVSQALALGALTVGMVALMGYVVGVDRASPSIAIVGMSLPTAVGLSLLGGALVLIRPSVGIMRLVTDAGPVGSVGRQLLGIAVVVPFGLAVLVAGLQRWLPDDRLGRSLVVVLLAVTLGGLLLVPVAAVERLERTAVDAERAARGHREALLDRDPVVEAITSELGRPPDPVPGWRLGVRLEPAHGLLAGDSLQVLRRSDGRVSVAVVDVAGHGATAGMLAFRLRAQLAALWDVGAPPATLVDVLNRSVADAESTATAVLVVLNGADGRLEYVNAGHPPPMVLRGGALSSWNRTGPLLGLRGVQHAVRRFPASEVEVLVVLTDGVPEARNEAAVQFGEEAVRTLVRDHRGETPEDLATLLVDAASAHGVGRLADDALVVVLARERARRR